ncbi:anti-sigma factor RsbA family regulatory protein [Pseudonocardia humida]|uniref:MEDS domain-containing protein n=1 Tax=Pseudonocardia humida TaxID=2800819 RepID=A0ABT1A049_9PSEU|nr:anti-sigma factor RsbA family regulatory protein [Pseudonocardia humida]MCO1656370.1 MEDS domain-containing protein [Pseudonocardia humida]
MVARAPVHRRGHVHQALFYDSDDELLDAVVPFVEEGLKATEPTLVALNDRASDLLREAVGHPDLIFLGGRTRRHDPASTIRHHRELLAAHVADGARHIRVVGETPHPGHGSPWDWWARYEAAINHAYAEFPLSNVCPYDRRITPGAVLEDVMRTHPWLAADDGAHVANAHYEEPRRFLLGRPVSADPLETTSPPRFELLDPTPAAARRAARACADLLPADAVDADDVVMCVNEAVTNALTHGRSPVRVRLWCSADRLVASVADRGAGPPDPFVGLLPAASRGSAGLGLWMAHQMCSHVTFHRTEDAFSIGLVFDARDGGR